MIDVQPHLERLALVPTDRTALEAVVSAYSGDSRWEELLTILQHCAWRAPAPQAGPLYVRAAEVCVKGLHDPGRAVSLLRQALEDNAGDAALLAALAELAPEGARAGAGEIPEAGPSADAEAAAYAAAVAAFRQRPDTAMLPKLADLAQQAQDGVALVRVVEQAMGALPSDAARLEALRFLAGLYAGSGQWGFAQLQIYRRILALAPDDAGAQQALQQGLAQQAQAAQQEASLRQRLSNATKANERRSLRLELAGLLEAQQGRSDEAAAQYLALLDEGGPHQLMVAGLERCLPHSSQPQELAARLQPLFAASAQWDRVAAMLAVRLQHAPAAATQVALLRDLAAVQAGKLLQPKLALATLLKAFALTPSDERLGAELEKMGTAAGELAQVAQAYRTAGLAAVGEAAYSLALRAAQLALQQGDKQSALQDLLRALAGPPAVNQKAAEGLRRLATGGVDAGTLYGAAGAVFANVDVAARPGAWRALAQLLETGLKRPSEAVAAWDEVLTLEPSDEEASRALDRLYSAVPDASRWAEYLRAKLARARTDSERAEMALKLANVLADRLQDGSAAAAVLQEVAAAVPANRQLFARLAVLYQQLGRLSEAAAAMYRAANLLPDGPERRHALVAYAALVGKELNDVEAALPAVQAVLTVEPAFAPAIALLEELLSASLDPAQRQQIYGLLMPAYRAGQRWANLAETLSAQVDLVLGSDDRVVLLRELAQLAHEKLRDPAAALAALERAFHDQPGDAVLCDAMERMAETTQRWESVAAAYRAALEVVQDPAVAEPIRRRLAVVLDKKLGRGEEALAYYRGLPGETGLPSDLASLQAMQALLRQQGRHRELAEVLEAMVARLPSEARAERAAALFELGVLWEEPLGEPQRAAQHLVALVALEPKHLKGLRRLAKLQEVLQQPSELAETLDKLVALGPQNPDLLSDMVQRGQQMRRLGLHAEAVRTLRAVLLKKRDHATALAELEALVDEVPEHTEIAQVLEPIYTTQQHHAKLAWILEKRLHDTTDNASRKALLRRVGDLYENRLQQVDKAFQMALLALSDDPGDVGVRMWAEKLAGAAHGVRQLADSYAHLAGQVPADLGAQFHRRAAALYHEKLADLPAAAAQYRALLALQPHDEKALTGLESVFRAAGDVPDLVQALRQQAQAAASAERRRAVLEEVARLEVEQLHELAAAVATYQEILTLAPGDKAAFAQVEKLLQEMSDWQALSDFYKAQAAALAPKRGREATAQRLALLWRRATVLDQALGDTAEAGRLFQAILQEDSTHASTLAYLEQRSQEGSLPAVALLEQVWSTRGDWDRYLRVLEQKLSLTLEVELRRTIFGEMCRVYDAELGDGAKAFAALTRAFDENRADGELLEQLQQLAGRYGLWEPMVRVLGRELDALTNARQRQELLRRLGEVSGHQLGQTEQAIGFLRQALAYDPSDHKALAALDALYVQHAMWQPLAEVLARRVELATEPAAKVELGARLAALWGDQLQDGAAALRYYQQVLLDDPTHAAALRQVERFLGEQQDWDGLAENLARQAEVLTAPVDQLRIHTAAALLYAEHLQDPAAAVTHWQQVLALEPAHAVAAEAVEKLLTAQEQWNELAQFYQERLRHSQEPAAKVEINRRLGLLLGEKLGRRDDALSRWLEVVRQDPNNVQGLRTLFGLYGERAMWQEYVAVGERLMLLVDPASAKDIRFELAKVLGENLGKVEEAVALARQVRVTEPHQTSAQLERLGAMLSQLGVWQEAVVTLEKAAAVASSDATRIALYQQAVQIYVEQLETPAAARASLEAWLALEPHHGAAYRLLAQVYRESRQWRKLIELHEQFYPHANRAERLELLQEIRDTHDKLGAKDLAFIAACRLFREDPTGVDAAAALERIGRASGSGEELMAVLEDQVEAVAQESDKIAIYQRLARVAEEVVGDLAAAEEAWNKILGLQPDLLAAHDARIALAVRQERSDKEIQALEGKLPHVPEVAAQEEILFKIASLWEEQIDDIDAALAVLARILEKDGAHGRALAATARLLEKAGRYPELAETMMRQVEACENLEESIALRLRLAALHEAELVDPDGAIQWYRSILDFDGANMAALEALERLYTGLERWRELIEVFELQWANVAEVGERLVLLTKMAAVYEEKFSSLKEAAQCFERALKIDASAMTAVVNLERLLRALGDWPRLVEVLQKHIDLLKDKAQIVALYEEMGQVYYRELGRGDQAAAVLEKALKINPKAAGVQHHLGLVYERAGAWRQAVEMLEAELTTLGKDAAALPLLLRLAKIYDEMLLEPAAGKKVYGRILALDPHHSQALARLKNGAREEGDWQRYADYLMSQAAAVDEPRTKGELFAEAAQFFAEVRHDEANAMRYYQMALECVPQHLACARALGDLYYAREDFAAAGELYRTVLLQLDKVRDSKELAQKSYRMAVICEKTGRPREALPFLREASEADPSLRAALEAYAHALEADQQWAAAQTVWQNVLVHHRPTLSTADVVAIELKLGQLQLQGGAQAEAARQFDKALELDPQHAPALRAAAELAVAMRAYERGYDLLQRLVAAEPASERVATLVAMSQLASEKLGDEARAIECLERARRSATPTLELLAKLAAAYQKADQAAKAAEVLEEAARLAPGGEPRAQLLLQLAGVYERQMKHEPLAVKKLNEALDAKPDHLAAFAAIERLLGGRAEWTLLEANYRAMINRAKELPIEVRVRLWRGLAALYHEKLADTDNAITAYEVLEQLDPGRLEDAQVLASLYAQQPHQRDKAIQLHHRMLQVAESPVAGVRTLSMLYQQGRDYDGVYVMLDALLCLGAAQEEELKLHAQLKRGLAAKASHALLREHWPLFYDAGLECGLGLLSAALCRLAPELFTRPAKDLGLRKKELIDTHDSDLYVASVVRYVTDIFGMAHLDIYRQTDSAESLRLVPAQPLALVVGDKSELLRDTDQRTVLFHVGRVMAYSRPELFLARAYPGEELREMLTGLCLVFDGSLAFPGDRREVQRWQQVFGGLAQATLKRLQPLAKEAYAELVAADGVRRFAEAVEKTAARIGMIAAGDLGTAVRVVAAMGEGASGLSSRERIQDLVLFGTSRNYLKLRRVLGTAVLLAGGPA